MCVGYENSSHSSDTSLIKLSKQQPKNVRRKTEGLSIYSVKYIMNCWNIVFEISCIWTVGENIIML